MADRVHPAPLLPLSIPPAPPTDNSVAVAETAPLRSTAAAPGASYVVHVPKDQALRIPPPDRKLTARPARRRMLRRACCGACCALHLAAAFVGAVYLVFRPRAPSFSVTSLSVAGILDPSPAQLDAAVRADNGANRKVGVDYRGGGEVSVSYSGVLLATGRWPAFYQAPRNVTLISMPLTGRDGVALTDDQRGRLAEQAAAGAGAGEAREGAADVDRGRVGAVRGHGGQDRRRDDGRQQGVQGQGQAALVVVVIAGAA